MKRKQVHVGGLLFCITRIVLMLLSFFLLFYICNCTDSLMNQHHTQQSQTDTHQSNYD